MNYSYKQFGVHFNRYCKYRSALGIKPDTLQREYEQHIHFWRYLESKEFEGDEFMIIQNDIQEYAHYVHSLEGISNYSKRTRLQRIRRLYQEAFKESWILCDPTVGIKLPKEEINPIKTLTVKQMKSLLELPDLNTVLGIRDRTMMELMYSSGLRRAEVIHVKRDDLSEDMRTIKVMGKGDKEVVLPVGKVAAHFLNFYCENIWPLINKHNEEYLFLSARSGKLIGKQPFYMMIRKYGVKLNPPQDIGPHVFRYSVCTHLVDEGVDIRFIQEFMRHEKISTTARYVKQSFQKLKEVHKDTHPRS